ncbi:hypothetical protein C0431_09445 [bacterium]|jgi:hypothetical protein|nr:hypothetical protein [bacterium]
MRGKQAVLNMLALFVFVLAQLPANAIASLFQHADCSMPCCTGKSAPSEDAKAPVAPASHCGTKQESHPCKTEPQPESISQAKDKNCGCEISAPTNPDPPTVALPSTSQTQLSQVDVALPSESPLVVAFEVQDRQPGILGSDSGPPISRPHCVCFGRAPPMFLA